MGAPQPLLRGGSSRGCGGCPAPRSGYSHGDCHEEEESDSGNVQPEPAGERRGPSGNVERDQDAPDRAADLSSGSPTELPQALPRARGLGGQLCTALSLSCCTGCWHCPLALPAPTAPAGCLGQLIPQTIPIKLLWQQKRQRWGGKTPLLRAGGRGRGREQWLWHRGHTEPDRTQGCVTARANWAPAPAARAARSCGNGQGRAGNRKTTLRQVQ